MISNLDVEFKRYLQIMRPYLGQLADQSIIEVCNAWIQRLSSSSEKELIMRNKYVFALCYQLARGVLDEPFTKRPPVEDLPPISEIIDSDSSTEVEYVVVDTEDQNTKVLFNNKKTVPSESEYLSQDVEFDGEKRFGSILDNVSGGNRSRPKSPACPESRKQTILCYTCPEITRTFNSPISSEAPADEYGYRATSLIKKLRDIKKQNMLLHNELLALKEESITKPGEEYEADDLVKVDNTTSAYMRIDSSATLKSLKGRLHELEEDRSALLETLNRLQEQLSEATESNKKQIEDLKEKHEQEIRMVKLSVREEWKEIYDNRLEEVKQQYESKIAECKRQNEEKIKEKDTEISDLKTRLNEHIHNTHSILNRFIEKPSNDYSAEGLKVKIVEIEKRFNRLEKCKAKCSRVYEAKLAQLQREKHLAECSLQLQLVRQRAQAFNEVADENQAELCAALDKLEAKYKEIVANVQVTAIQRRMQDQVALEAILQAACGIQKESVQCCTNQGQFSTNTSVKNHKDVSQSYDSEVSGIIQCLYFKRYNSKS